MPKREVDQRRLAALAIEQDLAGARRQKTTVERELADIKARLVSIPLEIKAARSDADVARATREQRRAERIAEIQARWKRAFLADDDTQDELTLHAQRMAEIVRMRDLADLTANAKLAVRIEVALSRENDRHDRRMTALQASFQAGGNP
jgi:hypothetical protein